MNREIKFQILYNNKVEGYERLTESGWEWMWNDLNPDKGERWNKGTVQDSHKLIRRQFTGLRDKNGKEIYEGDIYSTPLVSNYRIFFVNGSFCGGRDESLCAPIGWEIDENNPDMYISDWVSCKLEVIGNVFENPELLK